MSNTKQRSIPLSFVGTTTATIDLDPVEFHNRTPLGIQGEIIKILADIHPSVSFFPADIELAAHEVANAAGD